MPDDDEYYSDLDVDALEACIEEAKRESAVRKAQIEAMVARDWEEGARFACYSCQWNNLHLKLHQSPPCWVSERDDDLGDIYGRGETEARALLRQMLSRGISRFHPNPLRALAEVAEQKSNHAKREYKRRKAREPA